MKTKLKTKHNMKTNELKSHKNMIKSTRLTCRHQNKYIYIYKLVIP